MSGRPEITVLLDGRVRGPGIATYAETLAAGLAGEGSGVRARFARTGGWRRRPFSPWGRREVAREARRAGVDLIHGLHVELAAGSGLPCVVTIHDLIPLELPGAMPSRARRAVYRRVVVGALASADRVIVPSRATARSVARLGADPARMRVVPLAVPPRFRPASEEERRRARRRFAGGRPYVAASQVGRPHKNGPGLAVAAGLLARDAGLPVVVTGRPLPALARSLRFSGPLAPGDVAALFAGAEAVVVPSFAEGFGLPAAEALACGVPVVAGPGLGALPVLEDATVVDITDPARIAEGVEHALRGPAPRAGAAAVSQRLSPQALGRATSAVYAEVLGRAPAPGPAPAQPALNA